VNRIHAALHPDCFARLAAANHFDMPNDRLELPHFFIAGNGSDSDDTSRTPPDLDEDELRIINDLLAQEATRRKAVAAGSLRVLVDGIQMAQIEAGHSARTQFTVDNEAEVIEVYSQAKRTAAAGDSLIEFQWFDHTKLRYHRRRRTKNFIYG
jgi:hypothetical protein